MVHRPFRLAEIMTMLVKYKLEPKRMQLVYPLHRQGAQYGAHRGGARRQIPHDRGEAADRVSVAGSIYAGNI